MQPHIWWWFYEDQKKKKKKRQLWQKERFLQGKSRKQKNIVGVCMRT